MVELSTISNLTPKRKFNTNSDEFDSSYRQKVHLQTNFNIGLISGLSESIQRWFPDTANQPIKILDLCCGHGKPTYDLLNTLNENGVNVMKITGYDVSPSQIEQVNENGVNVMKITGYDVSPSQIEQAKNNYLNESKLEFVVQNVEEIQDKSVYDVVISLFGLHWMDIYQERLRLFMTL